MEIRCNNGPEFISKVFQEWCKGNDINIIYIQPGHPTQNSIIESFNGMHTSSGLWMMWENRQRHRWLTTMNVVLMNLWTIWLRWNIVLRRRLVDRSERQSYHLPYWLSRLKWTLCGWPCQSILRILLEAYLRLTTRTNNTKTSTNQSNCRLS